MNSEAVAAGSPTDDGAEPFPRCGLAALIVAAASNAPDGVLLSDDGGPVTAAMTARRMVGIAAYFRASGLVAGERVMIVAGAQTAAIVALAAALVVGAEPVMAPCGLSPLDLAAHARAAGAVALVGPSRYGPVQFGDAYLSVAAIVDTIRMVATQGPEPLDGAVDLSAAALTDRPTSHFGPAADLTHHDAGLESPLIATFRGPSSAPTLVLHRQAALFADALSLVEKTRLNPSKRLISTLPPATMAGLVAGPFAALVGASGLTLHGPFDTSRFLATLDAEPGAHIVAPCALGSAFEDQRLSGGLTSLVLVSRFPDPHGFELPPPLACNRPIVDLYAFGEETLLACRRTDGEARPPARVTDKSVGGGLGARLNRARAEHGSQGS